VDAVDGHDSAALPPPQPGKGASPAHPAEVPVRCEQCCWKRGRPKRSAVLVRYPPPRGSHAPHMLSPATSLLVPFQANTISRPWPAYFNFLEVHSISTVLCALQHLKIKGWTHWRLVSLQNGSVSESVSGRRANSGAQTCRNCQLKAHPCVCQATCSTPALPPLPRTLNPKP